MPYVKSAIGGTPEWVDELPEQAIQVPPPSPTTPTITTAEQPATFSKEHYGPLGLNGRFNQPNSLEFFAGNGVTGGGGKFEDPNERELASSTFHTRLSDLMSKMIDTSGANIVDVGAGTGLFLNLFRSMVGNEGNVFAIDITPSFVQFMHQRVQHEQLQDTVHVSLCTPTSTLLSTEEKNLADAAFICDVYHHFEYPKTFMKDLRNNLKTNGMVFLIDFYRQSNKMKTHQPEWALEHIRADRLTFMKEIEESGFVSSVLCVVIRIKPQSFFVRCLV